MTFPYIDNRLLAGIFCLIGVISLVMAFPDMTRNWRIVATFFVTLGAYLAYVNFKAYFRDLMWRWWK